MKFLAILLALVFASMASAGQATSANESKPEKKAASAEGKETRWQGTIVRIDKEKSTMSIRGGQANMSSMERQVSYDSSTHWTKQGKPAEQSEFKEGSFVIVLGHADEKGNLHASRIDLRLPR
jgi:hypothetical protein